MNIQDYIPPKEEQPIHHYNEVSSDRLSLGSTSDYKSTSSIPTILPTVVEEEYNTTTGAAIGSPLITPAKDESMASFQEQEQEISNNRLNPALLLNRFDKRKSSPAILGLPFGLNHEAQLSLHLSQQRNSIEAAMLLANFNKLMAFPRNNEVIEHKVHSQQQQWQDDMSIPSQNKSSWGDALESVAESNRRYSYDVNMSWQTMPEAFLERHDLLHSASSTHGDNGASSSSSQSDPPMFKQENMFNNNNQHGLPPTKLTWSHDDLQPSQSHHSHYTTINTSSSSSSSTSQHPYSTATTMEYTSQPPSSSQHRVYHPTMNSPLAPHTYQQQQQHSRYPPPLQQSDQHSGIPMLHPLARQTDNNSMKREFDVHPQQHPYYSYTFPPPPPPPQQQRYYYPTNGKLPLPTQQQQQVMDPLHPSSPMHHHPPPIMAKPKRKKPKTTNTNTNNNNNSTDDYGEELEQAANEEDYPDMSTRDVEAARKDPEARPRKQKLRFIGDKYTPQWVRYNGQLKEGLCDTCKPGKWLQLKNSAYWYHKQFFHGISSVSGKEFVQPIETRWIDQDLVEGLCHQCHAWVAVSNIKRKNSVLWYRHAHKCHVYHKPKPNVPKKR